MVEISIYRIKEFTANPDKVILGAAQKGLESIFKKYIIP